MLLVGFSFLKRKGINTQDVLEKTDKALTVTESVINVANEILPNNPIVNGLKVVEKYAHVGVNQAEQLYLTSQLKPDERNAKAKETIYAALTAAHLTKIQEESNKLVQENQVLNEKLANIAAQTK